MSVFVSAGLISAPGTPCKNQTKQDLGEQVFHTHTPLCGVAIRLLFETTAKVTVRLQKETCRSRLLQLLTTETRVRHQAQCS